MKPQSNDNAVLGIIFGSTTLACAVVLLALSFVPDDFGNQPKAKPAPHAELAVAPTPEVEAAPLVEEVKAEPVPTKKAEPEKELTHDEQMALGKELFAANCAACHRATGEGMAGMFPPLAKSDFLMADKKRSISILVKGLSGPIEVNGVKYNQMMPPVGAQLRDSEIAAVLTYVRNSFGNKGEGVTAAEVGEVRGALASK